MLMLTVGGQDFTWLSPESENVAVDVEAGKVVTEMNPQFEQNGQALPQPANSTETVGVPRGLTERSPSMGVGRKSRERKAPKDLSGNKIPLC